MELLGLGVRVRVGVRVRERNSETENTMEDGVEGVCYTEWRVRVRD